MDSLANQIEALQALFVAAIPGSITNWLKSGEPASAGGFPLLGLPIGPDVDNAWGATQFLRACRPDLAPDLLIIRLLDERALCVHVADGHRNDSSLFEVSCLEQEAPRKLNVSFETYLRVAAREVARSEGILDRVESLIKKQRQPYDHAAGGKMPRAHEWRVVRSCVHDRLVGVAGIIQDDRRDATVVDIFETADHPLYSPGHAVRSLMSLILSDAYKSGTSMNVVFQPVPGLRQSGVPSEVSQFARASGIALENPEAGVINHPEGGALFAASAGLPKSVLQALQSAKSTPLRLETLAYLVATGVWQVEEAEWILQLSLSPERLLLGEASPMDWLLYSESMAYGRSAVTAGIFRAALNEEGEEGFEGSQLAVREGFLEYRMQRQNRLPWSDGELLAAGDTVAVVPTPRHPLAFEHSVITADAQALGNAAPKATRRILVLSADARAIDLRPLRSLLDDVGVAILFAPYSVADLDQIVEARLVRARRVRQ